VIDFSAGPTGKQNLSLMSAWPVPVNSGSLSKAIELKMFRHGLFRQAQYDNEIADFFDDKQLQ